MDSKQHLRRRLPVSCRLAALAALAALIVAPRSRAQESTIELDPAQTKVEFTLTDPLHTVHGTFALKTSTIHFNPSKGKISGSIVVDATSGESANNSRDKRMHREVLESAKFPEIVFMPREITGVVTPDGASKIGVSGQFRLHGQEHEMTIPIDVKAEGQTLRLTTHIDIPYVQWGLKNPSNFLLHVGDKVGIDIQATSRLQAGDPAH
jgi:polyisoprenoid-binding protein YceI